MHQPGFFEAPTNWNGPSVAVPSAAPAGILTFPAALSVTYGVPPLSAFHFLLVVCGIVAISSLPLCPLFLLWPATALLFALEVFVITAWTMRVAYRNFHELRELQNVGPGLFRDCEVPPKICHATDVHMTVDDMTARIEGGVGGQERFLQWLAVVGRRQPHYIILSGDVTDTGRHEEWQWFEKALSSRKELESATFAICPGNHDLSKQYYETPNENRMHLYFHILHKACPNFTTSRGMLVSEVSQQARKGLDKGDVRALASQLEADFLRDSGVFEDLITMIPRFSSHGRRGEAKQINWQALAVEALVDRWYEHNGWDLFPLRMTDNRQKTLLIILNSVNQKPMTLGDSALGSLGDSQMSRFKAILNSLDRDIENVVVVLHHSPFRRPGEWGLYFAWRGIKEAWPRIKDSVFLAHHAREARELVDALSAAADQHQDMKFFMFCGHRHTPGAGRAGRVIVLEGGALCEGMASTWLVFFEHTSVYLLQESARSNNA